ncbi:MAG TPA: hypothetical protein VGP68_09385 [Gemmataceae bacterium]|jgi:hypothetical protein|nr:hypothetical protein [Gemmataceae bacterium]
MRVLFDQGTPAPLRRALTAHLVSTAYEMGWSALSNGDLLDAAETQFDAFVTTDQSLRYQQNFASRRLAILVLPFANWPKLQSHVATIVSIVDGLKPGDYLELALP